MRQVDRAIKLNQWEVDEAFQHVQAKLTGTAAVWYQNREHLFDKNEQGPEAGWQNFWLMFKQKYIA